MLRLVVAPNPDINLVVLVQILEMLLSLDDLSPVELFLCENKGFLGLTTLFNFELLSCDSPRLTALDRSRDLIHVGSCLGHGRGLAGTFKRLC